MESIISELWNGNIGPCEHCGAHDAQANRLIELIERNREALCGELADPHKAVFQKYIDCWEEYFCA